MIAIILATGCDERMRPLTYSTHKTLLPMGTETVLAPIILSLLELDISDIAVVTPSETTPFKFAQGLTPNQIGLWSERTKVRCLLSHLSTEDCKLVSVDIPSKPLI
jgi:NDP-sugar pyrophosphorylase family protein